MKELENISQNSLYFEKLIEHRFISDIMTHCWYKNKTTIEIIYTEIDNNGYDLIMCYENINRYIQLKTSEKTPKNSTQINKLIFRKENPCVIWIMRNYDNLKGDFNFKYLFWGSGVDEDLPDITKYKPAKQNKANAEGVKNVRQNSIVIPKSNFKEFDSMGTLFEKLFPASLEAAPNFLSGYKTQKAFASFPETNQETGG